MTTWDGKHNIDSIEVTMVYFLPSDRVALPDWQDRVRYFARRIEQFHAREFQGQSKLRTKIHDSPFRSKKSTELLRAGDADFIFMQTLREVAIGLPFPQHDRSDFPVLLVLSDINWRPLEDFYRLRDSEDGLKFEGQFIDGRHFPGATSGGSRATYLADRGCGWGLVSADGWRVPYCGTDCVVYHEGVGHPIGLPHSQPNASVMSLAQYKGWISESWIDDDQKKKLGWVGEKPIERSDLFSHFRALPEPRVPRPNQAIALKLDWPEGVNVASVRVRSQTDLFGPWLESVPSVEPTGTPPTQVSLGAFDRPTPVSYRVDAKLADGQSIELWGYFQVREKPDQLVLPDRRDVDAGPAMKNGDAAAGDSASAEAGKAPRHDDAVDLLTLIDPTKHAVAGTWSRDGSAIDSPKAFGARIEIPYQPPEEYVLTVVARPLDEPNGLLIGQRMGDRRFVVLMNFKQPDSKPANALENVDGENFRGNETTRFEGFFEQNRPSQIVCTVRKDSVTVLCDGREVIRWKGDSSRLSLSDYWRTPRNESLFLGAYDCRYRIERITLTPITGEGKTLP